MTRMVGSLGWHGQCACCCGADTKRQVKRQEDREWRREERAWRDHVDNMPDVAEFDQGIRAAPLDMAGPTGTPLRFLLPTEEVDLP